MDARHAVIKAPWGALAIEAVGDQLSRIDLFSMEPLLAPSTPLLQRVSDRLEAYFGDPHVPLLFPLKLPEAAFRRRVLTALCRIPVGQTQTYGELAAALATSPRAIGAACRSNPLPLIIPCHRVVSKHGLGGFAGQNAGFAFEVKRWLLAHEGGPAPSGG